MHKTKAPLKSPQTQRAPIAAPQVAPRPATPRPMSLSRAVVPLQRVGCACGGEIGADGQCADCRARRERVQRKMSVNPPGDALEQEADQVARAHIQRQAAEEPSAAPEMPVQRRMADKDAMSVQRRAADEHMPTQRQAAEPETPVQLKTADEETKPVQRQATEPETPVQRRTADEETKPVQPQAAEPEKPVQRQATEPETPVQRQTADEEATVPVQRAGGASVPEVTPAVESGIQGARGGGSALPPSVQRSMEDTMGADLSGVRVHNDGRADQLSRQLDARAFTSGRDIFFRGGEYNPESGQGRELLAHETAHTVQQGSGSETTSRAPAPSQKKGKELPTAPGEVDLLGKPAFVPSPEMAADLEEHKKALVKVKFGKMAEGLIPVKYHQPRNKKESARYSIDKQTLPLAHPLFSALGEVPEKLRPVLVIDQDAGAEKLTGYVGAGGPSKIQSFLQGEQGAQLLGLSGMRLDKLPKLDNKLENGHLILSITNLKVTVGSAFDGLINLKVDDDQVALDGSAQIAVPKLAKGELTLKRSPEGVVTGEGTVAAELPPQYSGSVKIVWDGRAINGEGKIGYKGEKLSGDVTLRLMEKEQAQQLKKEKQAPPPAEGQAPGADKAAPASGNKAPTKPKDIDYVVFGEGDMQFSFTEWLTGTAHVIVDHEGYLTIIGEITPQKEYELFPQKDYIKPLFKMEARAAYGVPVVGNIFIFANVGMDAFAKLGPVKFYNISVKGNYSTDPQQATEFEIRGSLNVSAAAGLRLRAEAGAGLEVLDHDIKAGAGINGIAGIRAYAEATPIIGRRAKGNPEEDKKEEYFIRGELEIAGQPFLGLSGDLFVELDSPWWSPAPDKKWTWPLINKEWPVGGSFGLLASVDYVFGSQDYPKIDFKPVDFSAEKFMTDLYEDKAQSKSGEGEPKKSDWKEKNSPDDAPPVGGGKGAVAPGQGGGEPATAKAKAPTGGGKANAPKKADPDARTAEGKSVKELKAEAAKKDQKPGAKDGKGKAAGMKEETKKTGTERGNPKDNTAAKQMIKAHLDTRLPNGAKTVGDVNKALNEIASKSKPQFTNLRAEEVMPGKPKKEGAIGFKVTAKGEAGNTLSIALVRYAEEGKTVSDEERWNQAVAEVKKAVTQLEKRGISQELIEAQFPKWQSQFGFKALRLITKDVPWVIEGEMSPGRTVQLVHPKGFADLVEIQQIMDEVIAEAGGRAFKVSIAMFDLRVLKQSRSPTKVQEFLFKLSVVPELKDVIRPRQGMIVSIGNLHAPGYHVHHIVPLWLRGSDTLDNYVLLPEALHRRISHGKGRILNLIGTQIATARDFEIALPDFTGMLYIK